MSRAARSFRALDRDRDLAAVAGLLGRTRRNGGVWHPGGVQWWLRRLGEPGFDAHLSDDGEAFVLREGEFVISDAEADRSRLDGLEWAEQRMRAVDVEAIEASLFESDALCVELERRGYARQGRSQELVVNVDSSPPPVLPPGFRWASLLDVSDDD